MRASDQRPPWRRVSFWFFFVVGTLWGSILGSWLVVEGSLPWPISYNTWFAERALEGVAGASRRTDMAASAFVCVFTLATALASAFVGAAWVHRGTTFGSVHRRFRIVPPEGDE